ncbi:hypothetical protein ACLOJK_031605 [Asimina triloba]
MVELFNSEKCAKKKRQNIASARRMVVSNSTSGSQDEDSKSNPDAIENLNTIPADNDGSSIENLARRVQELVSLGKRHKFWETQPVRQFKALGDASCFRSWHIGVRVKASKKLVAFITGVPARIRVYDDVANMAEINFLLCSQEASIKKA